MAKSTRSKVKRHFRAKKRTEGVYAAAEAARLNRLHKKLEALTIKGTDELEEEVPSFSDNREDQMRGWYTILGLFDPENVSAESMDIFSRMVNSDDEEPVCGIFDRESKNTYLCTDRKEGQDMFDHLFIEPTGAHGTR